MSIDIDWEGLTTGPEGQALAKSIRDFIHDKFQQVQLPRFIRSVEVHAFDFGKECPVVDLKDICDPLPEFYEDDEEDEDDGEDAEVTEDATVHSSSTRPTLSGDHGLRNRPVNDTHPTGPSVPSAFNRPHPIDTRFAGLRPDLSRSSTPGIPGGTSNLSYFHLPLSGGLSGTQTPLAAVAGGGTLGSGWSDTNLAGPYAHIRQHSPVRQQQQRQPLSPPPAHPDPSSRPSTSESFAQLHGSPPGSQEHDSDHTTNTKIGGRNHDNNNFEPDPSDVQIVLHISYKGTVRLSLTAEILLDYPMPSFVGIPLQLTITGLSFDGVALVAYLRKKAHFCFLGTEDARTRVGSENVLKHKDEHGDDGARDEELGGLLREIQVESEIGRQEGGKQVLRNVGKVEKFVLEQVRRIFEEEFVWPSFWTFLV